MYVTNGSIHDVIKWFNHESNKYVWLGVFLPSFKDLKLIPNIIQSVDNLDRLTRNNVALMTFIAPNRVNDKINFSKQLGHDNNKNDYSVKSTKVLEIPNGILNLDFTLLHTVVNKFDDNLKWEIENHIKRNTTIIADNLRQELALDPNKSYFLLKCKYAINQDLNPIEINEELDPIEIFKIFEPFWSSVVNIDLLNKEIQISKEKILNLSDRVDSIKQHHPQSLNEIANIYSVKVESFIEKNLDLKFNKCTLLFLEINIDKKGKFIIINGKKNFLYKDQRKELAGLINEFGYEIKYSYKIAMLEEKIMSLVKRNHEIVKEFNSVEKRIQIAVRKLNKNRMQNSLFSMISSMMVEITAKYLPQ